MVGKEYYPVSKLLMLLLAAPLVFAYSRIVDTQKKHNVLLILFTTYSVLILFFAYCFSLPEYGISNTITSPYRILGWAFTISMDFYPTFVIGTLWAFINSTSTPNFSKHAYAILYAVIKIAAILSTGTGFILMLKNIKHTNFACLLVAAAGIFTFIAAIVIKKLVATVPSEALVGFRQEKKETSKKTKLFEGFALLLKKPYVFGIFIIFYFYEVIFTIVEYQATLFLSTYTENSVHGVSFPLFFCATISQIIGLFITIFITTILLKKVRLSYILSIMPLCTLAIFISLIIHPGMFTVIAALTLLPAIHYSINSPAREMLFVPTSKEIQFKSKAWIDSFGRTISKSSGSAINMFFVRFSPLMSLGINSIISTFLVASWLLCVRLLGKAYQQAVDKDEVI
jgi:AAA family ATP:ADP antiporter